MLFFPLKNIRLNSSINFRQPRGPPVSNIFSGANHEPPTNFENQSAGPAKVQKIIYNKDTKRQAQKKMYIKYIYIYIYIYKQQKKTKKTLSYFS